VEAAGKPVSMAQLQGHFMLFKEQPHLAVANAELLSAGL
jgi:ethanolamine utilization cobalamin adenosyltransferase